MSDRDELAEIIVTEYEPGFPPNTKSVRLRQVLLSQYAEVADAILSSDWLAQHDRKVAAKTWDEGWRACCLWDRTQGDAINPYRYPEPIPNQPRSTCADPDPTPSRHWTTCASRRTFYHPCDCPRGGS